MSNKILETQDIVLAATLKTLGHELSGIEKLGTRGIFIFENINPDLLSDFDLGKLRVEPVAFNSAIRSLTTASRRNI